MCCFQNLYLYIVFVIKTVEIQNVWKYCNVLTMRRIKLKLGFFLFMCLVSLQTIKKQLPFTNHNPSVTTKINFVSRNLTTPSREQSKEEDVKVDVQRLRQRRIQEQCKNHSTALRSFSGGILNCLLYYKALNVLMCPVLKGKWNFNHKCQKLKVLNFTGSSRTWKKVFFDIDPSLTEVCMTQ